MTKVREVVIPSGMRDGRTLRVECFGEFDHEIDGRTFRFLITRDVNAGGLSKCITHKKSGARVCALGVGAAYLPAYAHLADDTARARLALDELCERHKADRVRCIIAQAEEGADAYAPSAEQSAQVATVPVQVD